MEEEISLKELYKIVKKHFFTILIAIVSGVIIAVLAMMFLVTPKYNSEAQLLVNQESSQQNIQVSEIQSNIQMINTYRDIITGHSLLSSVNERLGNRYTIGELSDAINVEQGQASQAFKISATMGTAEEAKTVLNELIAIFENTIDEFYGDAGATIFVLSPATYNPNRVSPRLLIFILIGAVIGFAFSVLIIIIVELMDTTVKEDDSLVQLGLINLGHVYELSTKELKQTRLSSEKEKSRVRERV
ncbi:YveK family protein [Fundicoccus sp. Sow4_F4]|uniref:YveK family protein n=1 Tax=Fundicoccus sp. Sow4_F4 TaxID=3438783 RepID=UPI003F921153